MSSNLLAKFELNLNPYLKGAGFAKLRRKFKFISIQNNPKLKFNDYFNEFR